VGKEQDFCKEIDVYSSAFEESVCSLSFSIKFQRYAFQPQSVTSSQVLKARSIVVKTTIMASAFHRHILSSLDLTLHLHLWS
jgi:hypothetical protein